MAMEEEIGVDIPNEEAEQIKNIEKAVQAFLKHLAKKEAGETKEKEKK